MHKRPSSRRSRAQHRRVGRNWLSKCPLCFRSPHRTKLYNRRGSLQGLVRVLTLVPKTSESFWSRVLIEGPLRDEGSKVPLDADDAMGTTVPTSLQILNAIAFLLVPWIGERPLGLKPVGGRLLRRAM